MIITTTLSHVPQVPSPFLDGAWVGTIILFGMALWAGLVLYSAWSARRHADKVVPPLIPQVKEAPVFDKQTLLLKLEAILATCRNPNRPLYIALASELACAGATDDIDFNRVEASINEEYKKRKDAVLRTQTRKATVKVRVSK